MNAVGCAFCSGDRAAADHRIVALDMPHIHWHVLPRLAADPAPRAAVWTVAHEPVWLAPVAWDERIAQLRACLSA